MSGSDLEIINIQKNFKKYKKRIKNKKKLKNKARSEGYRRHKPTKALTKRINRCLAQQHNFKIINIIKQSQKIHFKVKGLSDNYNVLIQKKPQCSCKDYINREDICKHIIFVYISHYKINSNDEIIYQKKLTDKDLIELKMEK